MVRCSSRGRALASARWATVSATFSATTSIAEPGLLQDRAASSRASRDLGGDQGHLPRLAGDGVADDPGPPAILEALEQPADRRIGDQPVSLRGATGSLETAIGALRCSWWSGPGGCCEHPSGPLSLARPVHASTISHEKSSPKTRFNPPLDNVTPGGRDARHCPQSVRLRPV